MIIYRPSFGRGGRLKTTAEGSKKRSEFGEFDAIVGTAAATYLVESKWSRSPELRDTELTLREAQIHRHKVFRWYLDNWRSNHPTSWEEFRAKNSISFEDKFSGLAIAPQGSILAQNLEFVLDSLKPHGKDVRDVLLYLAVSGSKVPNAIKPSHFSLVHMEYTPISPGGYFELR